MHSAFANLLALCLLSTLAAGHMEMSDPAPLKSKNNPNAGNDADFDLVAPISGDSFPCKGYLSLLGSPAGAPVATWEAGSTQSFTITGGAAHGGGSCQASLSLDGGKTFTVIHSYVGGCPAQGESSFDFKVPADTPDSDEAVFSWSWLNQIGNREFYQNCAVVSIKGGKKGGEKVPFDKRPAMFTANLGDGCSTADSADVLFPEPGPDADINNENAAAPVGSCGGSSGAPSDGGSGAPAGGDSGAPAGGKSGSPSDGGSGAPADGGSGSPSNGGSGAPANDGSGAPTDGGSGAPTGGNSGAPGSGSPADGGSGAPTGDESGMPSGAPQGGEGSGAPGGCTCARGKTEDDDYDMSWVTSDAGDGLSEQSLSALVVAAALTLAVGISLAA